MQYELKTQIIETRRKTFTPLINRFGDRPASRYEEGSFDIQPVENFHYRPTWAPDKELYDPAYSRFVLTDPYSFTDPRQLYYAPYVTARSGMHEAFGKTLDYVEERSLLQKMPQEWQTLMTECFVPLRHYESGGQLIGSGAARFAYGTTISQCCAYAGFDRVGIAQLISRVGIALGGGTADLLGVAKTHWVEAPHLQPLRQYVDELFVEEDWADSMIGLDLADHLVYGLLHRHLDEAALLGGAGAYSLVAQHLSAWFKDQRRWLDALYKAWMADPEHGESNVRELAGAIERLLPGAVEAVSAVAARVDDLVDADAVATVDQLVTTTRADLAALGIPLEEKSA